jgi:hypothetical protein
MATELKARIYYGSAENGFAADYTEFASTELARRCFKDMVEESLPSGWDINEDVDIDYAYDNFGGMQAELPKNNRGFREVFILSQEGQYEQTEGVFERLQKSL